MTILVSTILEIQDIYKKDRRSKIIKCDDQEELNNFMQFCLTMNGSPPNYLLPVEAVYQLFNLMYKLYSKKQNYTKDLITNIIAKCFPGSLFSVVVKLRENNIGSFEIFSMLWENQDYIDKVFLQLIELLAKKKWLAEIDLLMLSKFARNAQYVYQALQFLEKYKLDDLANVKLLCEQAEYAKILLAAWDHLEDNEFPFHDYLSFSPKLIDIYQALYKYPDYSLDLAKGMVYLSRKWKLYDYYIMLLNKPAYAFDLAKAFVMLVEVPESHNRNVEMITRYPQYACQVASALNILMTHPGISHYYSMLTSNPYKAEAIAQLLAIIVPQKLMNLEIQTAIVNNAMRIIDIYNIVICLHNYSSTLNITTLQTILIDNSNYIPDIAEKIMDLSKGEIETLNPVKLNKLIGDIKGQKEDEKKQVREKQAGIEPKADFSPLENIEGFWGGMHYLDNNIFKVKTKVVKNVAIDHIQKVYVRLLQHGTLTKKAKVLTDMCTLFDFINRREHKVMINIHKNLRYDTIFGKTNTNAWTDMMKVIRDQAYQLLMTLIDNEPDTQKKVTLLTEMSAQAIFTEHRTNTFFNRFHETKTVNQINQKIEMLSKPAALSLRR